MNKHLRSTLRINPEQHSYQVSGNRVASFTYALAGVLHMLRYAKNVRIQALATLLLIPLGLWLEVTRVEWALLSIVVMLNWFAEFINAALEATINMVTTDYHPMAQVAKDIAAGAVLIMSIGALVVGALIFLPPLWERLA